MRELVESLEPSVKDLAWGAETAREEKIREPAIAMMAVWPEKSIKEPPPLEGPLQVIKSGRSHAERREDLYTLLLGSIFGSATTIWTVVTIAQLSRQRPNGPAVSMSEYIATDGTWTFLGPWECPSRLSPSSCMYSTESLIAWTIGSKTTEKLGKAKTE